MTSILIIDDEPKIGGVLARMLARDGYEAEWTDSPVQALERLKTRPYDILVSDLRMPEMTGMALLERAKKMNPSTDFIMMTAYATPQTAVEAMKKGAIDYLIKPFGIEELKAVIRRVESTRASLDAQPVSPDLSSEKSLPASATPSPLTFAGLPASATASQRTPKVQIIAANAQMEDLVAKARKVAASNASVLLRGESGTGKEVFARAIHEMSNRADAPLVVVNCGAIPENLMESELFGHSKGAFTGAVEARRGMFETAHGGTIFLDEIGEMPLHLQVKLLRVLQEGEVQRVGEAMPVKVDVRVIAATNKNLEDAVAANQFRQDLFYRLNVIPFYLPPLRERRDDLPLLIQHFLNKFAPGGTKTLSLDSDSLLSRFDYPGNIRELENALEHAVVLSDGPIIQASDLPFQIQNYKWTRGGVMPASLSGAGSAGTISNLPLEEVEKRCILGALEKTRFNHTRAAAHLGITRRTLGYRIQKYGLEGIVEDEIRKLREARNG